MLKDSKYRVIIDATEDKRIDYSYYNSRVKQLKNKQNSRLVNKRKCFIDMNWKWVWREEMIWENKLGYLISRNLHYYYSFDLKLSTVNEYRFTIKILTKIKHLPMSMFNQINCLVNHSTSKIFWKFTETYKVIGLKCGLSLDSVPLKMDPLVSLDEIIKQYFVNKIRVSFISHISW